MIYRGYFPIFFTQLSQWYDSPSSSISLAMAFWTWELCINSLLSCLVNSSGSILYFFPKYINVSSWNCSSPYDYLLFESRILMLERPRFSHIDNFSIQSSLSDACTRAGTINTERATAMMHARITNNILFFIVIYFYASANLNGLGSKGFLLLPIKLSK